MSAKSRVRRGLIFGLICLRSYPFVDVRIDSAMQVTDVGIIRRTIIPRLENQKVGCLTLSLAAILTSVTLWCFLSFIARRPDMILDQPRSPGAARRPSTR
jgi:hypothetical protein